MKNTENVSIYKESNFGANIVLTMGILLLVFTIYMTPLILEKFYFNLRIFVVLATSFLFCSATIYGGVFKKRNQNILIVNDTKLTYTLLDMKPVEIPLVEIDKILKKSEHEVVIYYKDEFKKEPLTIDLKRIKKEERSYALKQLENYAC